MSNPVRDPGLRIALLAAGASTRLGQPKQLIRLDGVPLIQHAVDQAAPWVDKVWVVLGPDGAPFWQALRDHDLLRRLEVSAAEPSLSASLRAAVTAAQQDPGANRLMVMLVDQYLVDTAWLGELIRASDAHPDRSIASRYDGVRGVPSLFPRSAFESLQGLSGDRGAGAWLRQATEGTVVDVVSDRSPGDLDTPEQLAAMIVDAQRTSSSARS